jgi:hypothetical protein
MRFGARRSMSLCGGTAPQEGRRYPLKSRLLLANVATPATNSVGPDALGVSGPCFAARETSGMLQMISWRKNAWPSRPPPSMFGQRFKRAPFRSGISSGDDAWTLVTPGSFPLVRRSHGYPVFLPRLEIGRRLRRLRMPVHDDAVRLSPECCGCQMNFRPPVDRRLRQNEGPIRSRPRRPQSPSC